jgi:hypothetical protein
MSKTTASMPFSCIHPVKRLGVEGHVILHEGRDEEIGMVVARLQPDRRGLCRRRDGLGQRLGLQEIAELIRRAGVDQDGPRKPRSRIRTVASCGSQSAVFSPR